MDRSKEVHSNSPSYVHVRTCIDTCSATLMDLTFNNRASIPAVSIDLIKKGRGLCDLLLLCPLPPPLGEPVLRRKRQASNNSMTAQGGASCPRGVGINMSFNILGGNTT